MKVLSFRDARSTKLYLSLRA